jgi:hypothetical protein
VAGCWRGRVHCLTTIRSLYSSPLSSRHPISISIVQRTGCTQLHDDDAVRQLLDNHYDTTSKPPAAAAATTWFDRLHVRGSGSALVLHVVAATWYMQPASHGWLAATGRPHVATFAWLLLGTGSLAVGCACWPAALLFFLKHERCCHCLAGWLLLGCAWHLAFDARLCFAPELAWLAGRQRQPATQPPSQQSVHQSATGCAAAQVVLKGKLLASELPSRSRSGACWLTASS